MDEGSGAYANDTSQYGNNGTITGATWVNGYSLQGLEFDGVDDYIFISDSSDFDMTDSLTVSVWVNSKDSTDQASILLHDLSNYKYMLFQEADGTIQFYIRTVSGVSVTTVGGDVLGDGGWHYITGRYDKSNSSGRITLFVDGSFSSSVVGYDENILSGDEGIHLGTQYNSVSNGYNGTIDEVRIYNRPLSATEILDEYNVKFLAITAKDEDTNTTITGEELTIITTNATDLTTIDTQTTTTGEVIFSVNTTGNLIISAYTNDTYENQRRHLFSYGALTGRTDTTIKLLEDGRGLSQKIIVYDDVTYQGIQAAEVQINYTGSILDYGITDSVGAIYSYLDPYKLHTVTATAPGYIQAETVTLTPSTDTFYIYLERNITAPAGVTFAYNPSRDILNQNSTYIPLVTIANYEQLSEIEFIITAGRTYAEYYKETGISQAGKVSSEIFNMDNTAGWCNTTYICSITGNDITFRYAQGTLNDYADNTLILWNYTADSGAKGSGEKRYMFSDFLLDVSGLFTDTQKPWVGLGIMILGTFITVSGLLNQGYNPTVRQIGFIIYLLLLLVVKFGFLTSSFAIIGTLIYLGVVLGGRNL